MDTIHTSTHLDPDVMLDLLRAVRPAGIRSAMEAWSGGQRPKNACSFRLARQWVVLDEAGNKYPHRPLIALAFERCDQQEMNPANFGLRNDGVCRDWLESVGFEVGPAN